MVRKSDDFPIKQVKESSALTTDSPPSSVKLLKTVSLVSTQEQSPAS